MDVQLPQNDHDAIVTLTATSKVGFADVKADIADLKTVIAEIKGIVNTQYSNLDGRLKALENLSIQYNPQENLKKLQKHEEFITDYIATHKERNALWALWGAIIALVLSAISAISSISKFAIK